VGFGGNDHTIRELMRFIKLTSMLNKKRTIHVIVFFEKGHGKSFAMAKNLLERDTYKHWIGKTTLGERGGAKKRKEALAKQPTRNPARHTNKMLKR
jgi:hypothetical protein